MAYASCFQYIPCSFLQQLQSFKFQFMVLNSLWVDTWTGWKTWISFLFSAGRYPVFPETFLDETLFSPSYDFGMSVKIYVGRAACIHTCTFYSFSLVFILGFVPVPCFLQCCGPVVKLSWVFWYLQCCSFCSGLPSLFTVFFTSKWTLWWIFQSLWWMPLGFW
jgi:hypothetical protein